MTENSVRHDHASRCAAEVVKIINPDECKALQFGKVLYTILDMIYALEIELNKDRFKPSEN